MAADAFLRFADRRIRQPDDRKRRYHIRLLGHWLEIDLDVHDQCIDAVHGRRLRKKEHSLRFGSGIMKLR